MYKKNLQFELTVILVTVAFLGMTAVFVLSFLAARNGILKELLEKTHNMAEVEARKIDSWFEKQIIFTDTLGITLTQLNDRNHVLQLLKTQAANNDEYLTIFVGFSDNQGVFSDNWPKGTGPTPDIWSENATWKATERGWYKSAMANNKKVLITAPYQDALTEATVITVTKDIGKFGNLEAAVGIDVDVKTVVETINKVETQGGYAFLVDNEGHIVAHPHEKFAPKGDEYKTMSDHPVYKTIFPSKKNVYIVTDFDGVKRYIFPSRIASSGWILYAAIPYSAVAKTINPDTTTMVTAGAFILAAAFVVSMVVRRKIVKPLLQVVRAGERIAHGDLDVELTMNSTNEIGQLFKQFFLIVETTKKQAEVLESVSRRDFSVNIEPRGERDAINHAIRTMIETINEVMGDISDSVGKVVADADGVSNASRALSSGAQESAASLQEITASMHEISSQTQANAENSGRARDLAHQANEAAEGGQKTMREMTGAMDQITKNSSEIQRVIKVIDDIAFQTNLLALNAAVEAARAGQHGKGFAVVAEEVRNLASRSAKAARETSELISKSGLEIDKGGEIANHTAEVLNTIVDQIKQMTELIVGIAEASNEQALGVNQITSGLQQIDTVTQQNTVAAEESASAAIEMSRMATTLQSLVDRFKLRR